MAPSGWLGGIQPFPWTVCVLIVLRGPASRAHERQRGEFCGTAVLRKAAPRVPAHCTGHPRVAPRLVKAALKVWGTFASSGPGLNPVSHLLLISARKQAGMGRWLPTAREEGPVSGEASKLLRLPQVLSESGD